MAERIEVELVGGPADGKLITAPREARMVEVPYCPQHGGNHKLHYERRPHEDDDYPFDDFRTVKFDYRGRKGYGRKH